MARPTNEELESRAAVGYLSPTDGEAAVAVWNGALCSGLCGRARHLGTISPLGVWRLRDGYPANPTEPASDR